VLGKSDVYGLAKSIVEKLSVKTTSSDLKIQLLDELHLLHPKRVEKTCEDHYEDLRGRFDEAMKTTLETSEEDAKTHSKRVEKMSFDLFIRKIELNCLGFDTHPEMNLSSKYRPFTGDFIFSTRFECSFTFTPLKTSVVLQVPHPFRV
jgi:hypothetical protein